MNLHYKCFITVCYIGFSVDQENACRSPPLEAPTVSKAPETRVIWARSILAQTLGKFITFQKKAGPGSGQVPVEKAQWCLEEVGRQTTFRPLPSEVLSYWFPLGPWEPSGSILEFFIGSRGGTEVTQLPTAKGEFNIFRAQTWSLE